MDKNQDLSGNPANSVLDPANQHQHAHHHHTAYAEQGRQEEVVYSHKIQLEKDIHETPQEHASKSSNDEEAGQTYPAHRTWLRRLRKQWRHIVHAVVWMLFTG